MSGTMPSMRRTFCEPLSFVLHVTRNEGRSLAIATAQVINRVRRERFDPTIDFEYLDRWVGVLARVATGVASGRP